MARYTRVAHKGLANKIASLDGNARVFTAQLGSGTADNTVFLRGDQAWAAVTFTVLSGTITDTQHGVRTLANAHSHADLSGVTSGQHHAQSHTHNADSSGDVAVLRVSSTAIVEALAGGLTFPNNLTVPGTTIFYITRATQDAADRVILNAGTGGNFRFATGGVWSIAINPHATVPTIYWLDANHYIGAEVTTAHFGYNTPTSTFHVFRVNTTSIFEVRGTLCTISQPLVFLAGTAGGAGDNYITKVSNDLQLNAPTGGTVSLSVNNIQQLVVSATQVDFASNAIIGVATIAAPTADGTGSIFDQPFGWLDINGKKVPFWDA